MTEKIHIKINREYMYNPEKTQIILLGGLSQIGLNITLIETARTLIAIDCGMAFPKEQIGIDKLVPDVRYIKSKRNKFKGFFITHGHEDHIGGLSYVLQQLGSVDIYGLEFTCELIRKKLIADGFTDLSIIKKIRPNERLKIDDIELEFIRMSHSIPDSAAIFLKTPSGNLFHTGDFKVDMSAEKRNMMDFNEIESVQREHIHVMLSDSTNSEKSDWTDPEKRIRNRLYDIMSSNPDKRIIISTFSSNIGRIEGIINAAERLGRPVIFDGRSLIGTLIMAKEKNCISFNEENIHEAMDHRAVNDKNAVIVVTGSQGETTAVLSRIARGEHPMIKIKPDDMIIFSSRTIPGNENDMERLLNNLIQNGVKHIVRNVHTSGHANAQELKLMARLVHPDYIIPVHGDAYQRHVACETYKKVGYRDEQLCIGYEGAVYELQKGILKYMGEIPVRHIMLENFGEVKQKTIEERWKLSTEGIIIVAIDKTNKEVIDFETCGLSISETTKKYLIKKLNSYIYKKCDEEFLMNKISEEIYSVKGKLPIIKIFEFKGEKHEK